MGRLEHDGGRNAQGTRSQGKTLEGEKGQGGQTVRDETDQNIPEQITRGKRKTTQGTR
jgi:hypothetical protein